MDELVWHVCDVIRTNQFAGISESQAKCYRCPKVVITDYGDGTLGCRRMVQAIIELVRRADSASSEHDK